MKPTTITDDRIAQVEIMLEDGPVTSSEIAAELGFSTNNANHLIKKMLRMHIIEEGRPKWANNNWNKTYIGATTKPKQASMFSAAKRDALVEALFGDYTPPEGAAWVF